MARKDLVEQGINNPEKFGHWKRPDGSKPTIACTAIGSGTWMYGNYILEKYGVGERVTWVNGGAAKTMLGGLASKQFDAIMAAPSLQFDAEDHGWGRVIYDVTDQAAWDRAFGGPVPTTAIYALVSTIQAAPDVTQAFVNAVSRSLLWSGPTMSTRSTRGSARSTWATWTPRPSSARSRTSRSYGSTTGSISEADFNNGGKVWFREGTDIKPIGLRRHRRPALHRQRPQEARVRNTVRSPERAGPDRYPLPA